MRPRKILDLDFSRLVFSSSPMFIENDLFSFQEFALTFL